MIGRLLRPADFERVLATLPRARSAHFAVHHVDGVPARARPAAPGVASNGFVPGLSPELSTGQPASAAVPVDDPVAVAGGGRPSAPLPGGHWLGLVVPKRHAKRAVTRNLIKRQVRALMHSHAPLLPPGMWVVRLRQGFDRATFSSPASDALQGAARAELTQLFARAAQAVPASDPARAPRRKPA